MVVVVMRVVVVAHSVHPLKEALAHFPPLSSSPPSSLPSVSTQPHNSDPFNEPETLDAAQLYSNIRE